MKHAFISYGMGGVAFDPPAGERQLVSRLKAIKVNTHKSPYEWSDINNIALEVGKIPIIEKIIVGGDSLGANEAPHIAKLVKRNIDLLFGFQPSQWGEHVQIPSNVKDAWCIYNPAWAETMGLGNYPWSLEPGNHTTRLHLIPIHMPHPGDWGVAQDIIYKAIKQL